MTRSTILLLLGSLRTASINREIAQIAIAHAPNDIRINFFDRIGELPHYNEDIDTEPAPDIVSALRAAATSAQAGLVITPEYNGTIPGVLKNAIDWLSRPYGNSPLKGKPVAVIGASLGSYGGVWAHDDTRKALRIAGPRVVDAIALSVPTKTLRAEAAAANVALVEQVTDVVRRLAAEMPPWPPSPASDRPTAEIQSLESPRHR
ncbi:NADPH-dependent FMN reductase [Mycolicibacterium vinylchloridicum]|uniref:NADPH-dependent FMN reductase n=1 Tax=Mycolicibacterium vinylchloridicum TaxID=2736928 RepID=UPI0015C8651C|nr:NADPH-dependent FMN reductase [Mycolicibacterium vinylchloridicum]